MANENQKTVTINGHRYDARTGLPLGSAPALKKTSKPSISGDVKKAVQRPVRAVRTASSAVHATLQRSKTLNRRIAQKHSTQPAKNATAARQSMDISRSKRIAKFAPNPHVVSPTAAKVATPKAKSVKITPDKPAVKHPLVSRAAQRPLAHTQRLKRAAQPVRKAVTSLKAPSAARTSQDIKNAAIATAMATTAPKQKKVTAKPSFFARHRRGIIVTVITAVLLVGAGAVTLANLPILSVNLAAAQAGIKAGYPGYTPDGYSLEQPVTFHDGHVTLRFNGNGGQEGYVIKQERSSWDSTAVLDNIVKKAVGDNYTTTQDSGLTIYSYNSNAAWVNAGILYTITNGGNLNNEQVNAIATSL